MGYTTDFYGHVTVDPPFSTEEIAFLKLFNETRRMNRRNGPYFVDGTGFMGQNHDADVIDFNSPPKGQPGLWCQWVPTEDGAGIEWDGGEKFYHATEWMQYLIEHFVGCDPIAKQVDPERFAFLQGHTVNGEIEAQGESYGDHWKLVVTDNVTTVLTGAVTYS